MLSCDGTGKVVTVVVSRDVSVTTTSYMYALQLNAIPAWGLQMSLGMRDSMELVQVQKLSPKIPNTPWQRRIINPSDFLIFL